METITFRAMGCQMQAWLDAPAPRATTALDRGPGWFTAWEQCLSRFLPDSELSRLNRRVGSPTAVSATLWETVGVALAAARASDGIVSPALLPALEAAGYERTFATLDRDRPAAPSPWPSPAPDAWRGIQRRARRRAIFLPPRARLDLAGTAKGWAADRAAQRLSAAGPALVDAGGDIAVSGPRADGSPWPVAVGTADDDAPDLDLVRLCGGGIATSGIDFRRWQRGGIWRHHLIDPRTGQPAETDVITASVIGPSATAAEVGAKVALILGSRAGLAWIEARPALAALLLRDDGRIVTSHRWAIYR
jgi:thiamine biosynthesis lipoprotein